jgi:hypothetical protein
VRRPRYTADLPAPLGFRPSPLRQGRQSIPARPYTPSSARQTVRRTPVVDIPPDEESTADEAFLRVPTGDEAQTDGGEADDDELVEDELSEQETDREARSSDGALTSDAEMEVADESRVQGDENDADGDDDDDSVDFDDQARLGVVDVEVTLQPSPRSFRPREGKQRVALSDDSGTPFPPQVADSTATQLATPADDEEDEVALLTQVDGSE